MKVRDIASKLLGRSPCKFQLEEGERLILSGDHHVISKLLKRYGGLLAFSFPLEASNFKRITAPYRRVVLVRVAVLNHSLQPGAYPV